MIPSLHSLNISDYMLSDRVQPVLETDGSQISRIAQLENKVGRITDAETRQTPKNQEKTSVATTPKRIRNRHKESAITHNTKKSVGIIKKIAEPVAKTIMLHETMIAPMMYHNSTQIAPTLHQETVQNQVVHHNINRTNTDIQMHKFMGYRETIQRHHHHRHHKGCHRILTRKSVAHRISIFNIIQ